MIKFKEIECNKIANLYKSGKTSVEIGKLFNRRASVIVQLLRRRQIPIRDASYSHRKYKINEHCFDNLDTEEAYYFLGLLFADGSNKLTRNTLELSLQIRDIEILQRFNTFLNTNKPIKIKKMSNKNPNWSDQGVVTIYNKYLVNKLYSLGMVSNKSLKLSQPNVNLSKNLIRHFIRGFFDGDGHISIQKSGIFNCNISSTKDFCLWLSKVFNNYLYINTHIRPRYKNINRSSYMLYISGKNQIMNFLNWIYHDANVYINRKYERYIECEKITQK